MIQSVEVRSRQKGWSTMGVVFEVLLVLIPLGFLIYVVMNFPALMRAKIKRDRERRAYYDSPYEPGDPPWRRQVPPWTNEGIDEQPRPEHHHHPEHHHQHHQAPGVSPAPTPHYRHEPGVSSKPEPHPHSPPSDPPSKHHHLTSSWQQRSMAQLKISFARWKLASASASSAMSSTATSAASSRKITSGGKPTKTLVDRD